MAFGPFPLVLEDQERTNGAELPRGNPRALRPSTEVTCGPSAPQNAERDAKFNALRG